LLSKCSELNKEVITLELASTFGNAN